MADQDNTPLGDALSPPTSGGDQSLIEYMRKLAKTAKNRYPWSPAAQQAEINEDQKISDRLSSPNHRLPVGP
jgi:hypothetical protein